MSPVFKDFYPLRPLSKKLHFTNRKFPSAAEWPVERVMREVELGQKEIRGVGPFGGARKFFRILEQVTIENEK